MLTGVVEPKLRDGRFCAPEGLEAMAAVRATLPVKLPLGVMVMAEVFPVVAPGETLTEVAATVKSEGMAAATVSSRVFEVLGENSVVP
jgi:hypothetical protein